MIPAPASGTAGDLVAWAEGLLRPVSDSARLEAELLLADSAGLDRAAIMAHPERPVTGIETARLTAMVSRRSSGEPLAYLVGYREFYSLRLEVDPSVLVPRSETELVVELALGRLPVPRANVLDLGTGSGAIALAMKHERPELAMLGVDSSPRALGVARRNAAALNLAVSWLQSDWFAGLEGRRFDLIVANPPYVRSRDPHFDSALNHEPRLALDGGEDGLDAYRAILADAASHLRREGVLVFEHGYDQREALAALAAAHGFAIAATVDDLAARPRAAALVRSHGH